MRKRPRWAKVLWYIAWGIGVAGIIFTALKPSDFAVGRTVRVYLGIYGFICGFLGFYHSFSPDLQPSEQVSPEGTVTRYRNGSDGWGSLLSLLTDISAKTTRLALKRPKSGQ